MMIRLVLADDQVILRDSLRFILEQSNEIRVVAVVGNGKEAFEACRKLNPDVVLMDIMMPESDGIEGTQLIKEAMPHTKILILTTFDDDINVSAALSKGADGYLLKDVGPHELIMAVKNICGGFVVMHKNAFEKALKPSKDSPFSPSKTLISANKPTVSLTERELSIVRLIVDGKNNREISKELFLSEGTVKNIVTTILEKLELRDRTQLAVFAIKNGLI